MHKLDCILLFYVTCHPKSKLPLKKVGALKNMFMKTWDGKTL